MAVFPKGMKQLDVSDGEGSLRTLEEYVRYMAERMEFAMTNTNRTISGAGISNVVIYQRIQEMAGSLSALQSTVTTIQGTMKKLEQELEDGKKRLEALEQAKNEEA